MNSMYELDRWRKQSETTYGFHTVFSPQSGDCKSLTVYRLNLQEGGKYTLNTGSQEMSLNLVKGAVTVSSKKFGQVSINKLDSVYLPGNQSAEIQAKEESIFYIGAAVCEGYGEAFFRRFDSSLPIGDMHQIHGKGTSEREVMFTLAPQDSASRLICGFSRGGNGSWTSWPPHQHEKDLEEAYCYFDMDPPQLGFHISYFKSGHEAEAVAHPVQSGTIVLAPVGYHPTVATPGTRNTYLWILAAHSHESRRYDLAITDPNYVNT